MRKKGAERKVPIHLYLRLETVEELSRLAEEGGFDSISAFVEYLVRRYLEEREEERRKK